MQSSPEPVFLEQSRVFTGLPHFALRLRRDKLAIHCVWDCFYGASPSVDIDGEGAAGEGLGIGTDTGHAAPAGNVPPRQQHFS